MNELEELIEEQSKYFIIAVTLLYVLGVSKEQSRELVDKVYRKLEEEE